MPRKVSQSDRGLGRPQNARPFDPKKRAEFLKKIAEGASLRSACGLVGVSRQTVGEWRLGARPEHALFARAYEAAREEGLHKNTVKVFSSNDPKVMLEVQRALDPRFGDVDLRRRKCAAEIERIEVETRGARVRVEIQEVMLEKARAGGEDGVPAFGLATLLDAPELSEGFKAELARYIIAKGMVTVERAKLAGPSPSADGGGA